MRHVSRTHRVQLGWLYEIIRLNSNISLKYVHADQQIEDICLPKGSFTRDNGMSRQVC